MCTEAAVSKDCGFMKCQQGTNSQGRADSDISGICWHLLPNQKANASCYMGCLINPTLAWNTMPQISALFHIIILHLSEYLFPQTHFEGGKKKRGEMPTSEETRFEQGYQEQVLLPQSPPSQNRTLLASTPAAMINTAVLFWELPCCTKRQQQSRHDTSLRLRLSKQTYLKRSWKKKASLGLTRNHEVLFNIAFYLNSDWKWCYWSPSDA